MQTNQSTQTLLSELPGMKFCHIDGIPTLPTFLQFGCLEVGMEIWMERNKRTDLELGFVIDWKFADLNEQQKRSDLRGAIFNSESTVTIYSYKNQRVEDWPFTMLYIK